MRLAINLGSLCRSIIFAILFPFSLKLPLKTEEVFRSVSSQSPKFTPTPLLLISSRFKMNCVLSHKTSRSITIHSLFLQNNKNSLTNKDFFILSILTSIYSWRWNKRTVMSISSPLGSVPTLFLRLYPRQAWQESIRAYCCVFDEVYRLFNDWWHIDFCI